MKITAIIAIIAIIINYPFFTKTRIIPVKLKVILNIIASAIMALIITIVIIIIFFIIF